MPVKTISISQITNFVYNGIGKAESYFAKLLKSAFTPYTSTKV